MSTLKTEKEETRGNPISEGLPSVLRISAEEADAKAGAGIVGKLGGLGGIFGSLKRNVAAPGEPG
jgi:hypothetical protein